MRPTTNDLAPSLHIPQPLVQMPGPARREPVLLPIHPGKDGPDAGEMEGLGLGDGAGGEAGGAEEAEDEALVGGVLAGLRASGGGAGGGGGGEGGDRAGDFGCGHRGCVAELDLGGGPTLLKA